MNTIESNKTYHRLYMREWNKTRRAREAVLRRRAKKTPELLKIENAKRRKSGYGKEYALRTRYGISVSDRDAMLAAQGNVCGVCSAATSGWKHYWSVDHCHKTKKVRGILCHRCNVMLGHVRESTKILRCMISYLEKHGAVT